MRNTTRATRLAAWMIAVMVAAALSVGCARKPKESTVGSTDTTQPIPQSTGTTATETGGGPPVSTTAAPSTTGTTATTTTATTTTGTGRATGTY